MLKAIRFLQRRSITMYRDAYLLLHQIAREYTSENKFFFGEERWMPMYVVIDNQLMIAFPRYLWTDGVYIYLLLHEAEKPLKVKPSIKWEDTKGEEKSLYINSHNMMNLLVLFWEVIHPEDLDTLMITINKPSKAKRKRRKKKDE